MMKRKYSVAEVRRCLDSISQIPTSLGGVFVGMDVITGFPGESEEEFEESYQLLSKLSWTRLHVFPYSERQGTPATRLPNPVPQDLRVKRARRLNELSLNRIKSVYEGILAKSQAIHGVLLERSGTAGLGGLEKGEWVSGYTPNYLRVLVRNSEASGLRNQIVSVIPKRLVLDQASGDAALISVLM